VRFDHSSTSGDFWSPSLGLTRALTRNALLRATVARGFHAPQLTATTGTSEINMFRGNPALTAETVWSYQAGFEASVLDDVWLKVSLFRHDLDDAIVDERLADPPDWWTMVNGGRQRRQGVEVGLKSKPVHHFTFAGNAFFMKTEDLETGEDLLDIPRRVFDLSVKYDDERSLRALLKGRYTYAVEPEDYDADLGGFIFDLNLARRFALAAGVTLEAFLSVHNLFNGAQYYYYQFPNPDRWVEGGVRVAF